MTAPVVFAKTVVFRHPCECESASLPLREGEEPEHRFDVDGAPFPWLIAGPGPRFVRRGELVLITVDIFPMDPDTYGWLPFSHTAGEPPAIGGRPFPWSIVGEFSYRHEHTDIPKLTLTFAAEDVDADCDIPESQD